MYLQMLKGKIHRATVIQAELNYVGSITIDEDLLDAASWNTKRCRLLMWITVSALKHTPLPAREAAE